ncbi:hypothetical protein NM22_02950 [Vibrio tubiashii]|nr:hypothetical protein NM22_02950 [Vibrio tubiashii]
MKKLLIVVVMFFSSHALADTAKDVLEVIEANLKYTQNEDVEATVATMHPDSLSYYPSKHMMEQLFPTYDLKYVLLDYKFLGSDADYAYARVLIRTTKVDGAEFRDNEIDAIQVFKQDNGKWKLFSQANMTINYL